jgi:magnesium transporter
MQLMKRFSACATIVLPLTLIAGIWGMNVVVPGQDWFPPWLWFYLIIAFMALMTACMVLMFRKLQWL